MEQRTPGRRVLPGARLFIEAFMKYNCDSCVFDTEDIQEAIEHEQTYEGHWTILQHNFFGDPD